MKPLVVLLLTISAAFGQAKLEFEVASIKPADPNFQGTRFQVQAGGGIAITGATLRQIIVQAYNTREFQLTGGPSWVNTERFDIRTKANENFNSAADLKPDEFASARERILERVRNLLEDRFQLRVRREMKEQPAFALVVAKGGHQLKAVDGSNVNMADRSSSMRNSPEGRTNWTAKTADMELVTRSLAAVVGRAVVDRTGLTGSYDFTME